MPPSWRLRRDRKRPSGRVLGNTQPSRRDSLAMTIGSLTTTAAVLRAKEGELYVEQVYKKGVGRCAGVGVGGWERHKVRTISLCLCSDKVYELTACVVFCMIFLISSIS